MVGTSAQLRAENRSSHWVTLDWMKVVLTFGWESLKRYNEYIEDDGCVLADALDYRGEPTPLALTCRSPLWFFSTLRSFEIRGFRKSQKEHTGKYDAPAVNENHFQLKGAWCIIHHFHVSDLAFLIPNINYLSKFRNPVLSRVLLYSS